MVASFGRRSLTELTLFVCTVRCSALLPGRPLQLINEVSVLPSSYTVNEWLTIRYDAL